MIIEEATEWKVINLFDYDDYYQVGRDIVVNGKQAWQSRANRYRSEASAVALAKKLNEQGE
jgi:hypothetical protein